MYKSFYNLTRNPFDITPDPSFLFATTGHNEALAALHYAVWRRKGLAVLTGEVGTGKTLMLRCLLQLVKQRSDIDYAYVFSSRLDPTEFLRYVASDLGLPVSSNDKGELLFHLCHHVVTRSWKKLTTVLIVDEAQCLSEETLEEIRLLTNLETADEKLLQMVLVGQPELDQKLDSPKLRQLKQRITIRTRLMPLDGEETRQYIHRRLHFAGANSHTEVLFPADTVRVVYQHSRGIPRIINTICENSLITAYARQLRTVTAEIVEGVAEEFRLTSNCASTSDDAANFKFESDVKNAAKALLDLYSAIERRDREQPNARRAVPFRVLK